MPIIHVRLFEGRSVDQKRAFAEAVTQDAVRLLGCTPESVDVIYTDMAKSDWATAGKLWSDPKPG